VLLRGHRLLVLDIQDGRIATIHVSADPAVLAAFA
jgi:hypothetical protein